jgi:pseudomonalisin
MFILPAVPARSQEAPMASKPDSEAQIPARFRTAMRSLITKSIDPARTTPTRGAVSRGVAVLRDLGPVERSLVLDHLQLVLRRPAERQAAFDAFVEALHRPGSDVYRHWLKPDHIGTQFGPSPLDIEAVCSYLESEGFAVNHVGKSGMFVDFTGTAQQVESTFHTEIHYVITRDGQRRYSAVSEAWLPEALAPLLVGFASMSNIEPQSAFEPGGSPAISAQAKPQDTTTCSGSKCYYVGPQDFYTIYNEDALLAQGTYNGKGVTIALLEQSDINSDDVTTFRTTFNVVPNMPSLTLMKGISGTCSDPGITAADEHEAILDAEWAGTTAPGASLLFVSCAAGPTAGFLLSAEAVIDGNLAPIMSLSYINAEESGGSPENQMASSLWEQAATQGQTVVICAGDTGSAYNVPGMHQAIASQGTAVNGLASTPYNVAAGGTDFQDTYNQLQGDSSYGPARYWRSSNSAGESSAVSYVPETAWNDSCAGSLLATSLGLSPSGVCDMDPITYENGGGSGGVSVINPRPSWQNGTVYGLPAASGVNNYRLVPDLSFYASDGSAGWGHRLLYYQSDATPPMRAGGGTSFVAPQVAGIFAVIEQKTGSLLGQPNYVLYSLAGTAFGTTTFTGAGCNGSGTTTNTGTTSATPDTSCIFYDIVSGNNSQECSAASPNCYSDQDADGVLSTSLTTEQPAYPAGQGYDLATGIGSANISNLVNAWPMPTFVMSVSPTTITIVAGQTGTATVTIAPVNGFSSSPVKLICSGQPPDASCSFSSSSVTPSGSGMTSELSITTTADAGALLRRSQFSKYPMYVIFLPWLAIAIRISARQHRNGRGIACSCLLVLVLTGSVCGCKPQHSSNSGTPAGTYTITVTASASGAAGISQSASVTVTITN